LPVGASAAASGGTQDGHPPYASLLQSTAASNFLERVVPGVAFVEVRFHGARIFEFPSFFDIFAP
jgi:hypothetical protein